MKKLTQEQYNNMKDSDKIFIGICGGYKLEEDKYGNLYVNGDILL